MPRTTNLENTKNLSLIDAASAGNNTLIEELISAKADVNTQDDKGNTALMLSGDKGNINGVEILIKAGADISLTNRKGEKFIDIVCDKKYNGSFLTRLEDRNLLKIDKTNNKASGDLCKNKENISINPLSNTVKNIVSNLKIQPVGWAVLSGNHSLLHTLIIDQHRNSNERSEHDYTPLMFAALINDDQAASFLKGYQADISLVNNENKTAIDIACEHSSEIFLEVFFEEPLIEKENSTNLYPEGIEKWRWDIGQFCLKHNQKNNVTDQLTNRKLDKNKEKFGNVTGHLVATSTLVTTLAAGVIATTENIVKAINGSTINNVTHDMVAFHPDHSENMGGLAMAAVGVTAVGILGGLVWGTRACLNLSKKADSYHKNLHSTELSLLNHS